MDQSRKSKRSSPYLQNMYTVCSSLNSNYSLSPTEAEENNFPLHITSEQNIFTHGVFNPPGGDVCNRINNSTPLFISLILSKYSHVSFNLFEQKVNLILRLQAKCLIRTRGQGHWAIGIVKMRCAARSDSRALFHELSSDEILSRLFRYVIKFWSAYFPAIEAKWFWKY